MAKATQKVLSVVLLVWPALTIVNINKLNRFSCGGVHSYGALSTEGPRLANRVTAREITSPVSLCFADGS